MTNLEKLFRISSSSLGEDTVVMPNEVKNCAGRLAEDLTRMLQMRNGFFAFSSALHVFPSSEHSGVYGLGRWNAPTLWRDMYGGRIPESAVFFAEDAFGFQFAIFEDAIWTFDPETLAMDKLAGNIEGWASALFDDIDFLTGRNIASQWQEANRQLLAGERLFPKTPFVLGGKFELGNLVAHEAAQGMCFRGFLSQKIKDLPDGTQVNLVFEP